LPDRAFIPDWGRLSGKMPDTTENGPGMTQPTIDAHTRILPVIGDPIAQVRAPTIWNPLFQHNGINAVCLPMRVPPSSLHSFWEGIRALGNLVGLVVTIPHKPTLLPLLDEASPRARQVGAVNAVLIRPDGRALGEIFDGIGFVEGLRASGQRVDGRRALIVGSGGVGSAIAFGVAEAGAREINVSDINEARSQALSSRLHAAGFASDAATADPAGYDLVVNATPLGMRANDPLPFDSARLDPAAIVADAVIGTGLTPVLLAARERGCFVQPGVIMTDQQIALYAPFFGFEGGDWSSEAIARLLS
jgi:shikimate dehydrogenase